MFIASPLNSLGAPAERYALRVMRLHSAPDGAVSGGMSLL
jgi:hypothetical protein